MKIEPHLSRRVTTYIGAVSIGVSEIAKGAFLGATVGVSGGTFVGAMVDAAILMAGGADIESFSLILSIMGSAGTGAVIGGSALASVGAAAGGMKAITLNAQHEQLLISASNTVDNNETFSPIVLGERQVVN